MNITEFHPADLLPIVTPCPVPWCDASGHHEFYDSLDLSFRRTRTCSHDTSGTTVHNANPVPRVVSVAAEVHQNEEDQLIGPYVVLDDGRDTFVFDAPHEVMALIAALTNAGRCAFGDEFVEAPTTVPRGLA